MTRLEQTDRIARVVLIVAIALGCVSPFALGALKDSDAPAADASSAKTASAAKGALVEAQYMPSLAIGADVL